MKTSGPGTGVVSPERWWSPERSSPTSGWSSSEERRTWRRTGDPSRRGTCSPSGASFSSLVGTPATFRIWISCSTAAMSQWSRPPASGPGPGSVNGACQPPSSTIVLMTPHKILSSLIGLSGAEVNIKPWKLLVKELRAGNEKTKWKERARTAYWKGNPYVSRTRRDLLKCNLSESHDWNARLYIQNWEEEIQRGFKQSNLADQCTHRYKIYVEGVAWSVSRKYILACDSPTLSMKDRYYDFFSRSLLPGQHFWPISADNKCPSIKFAVDWGNSHPQKAQEIGKAGSSFILNDMRMENVYDYMFHALTEYAKLLRYKPTIPSAAKPVCLESMASSESGRVKEFMIESMVEGPRNAGPCALPPPDSAAVESLTRRKKESVKQVQRWEREGRDRWNKRR
ncbi:uncharacterized protein LOC116253374 isoform X6 [Nymphaea colorata]|uniref:uncharacterized protein LOC116253374 isoform X6 n=1 Tax=Nymphaea colorata TaxID=210225 RepID=UPI00129ECE9F|nr:uncharacterized protein LOC116253374 isoform X6 [Nymphaea colorata]